MEENRRGYGRSERGGVKLCYSYCRYVLYKMGRDVSVCGCCVCLYVTISVGREMLGEGSGEGKMCAQWFDRVLFSSGSNWQI